MTTPAPRQRRSAVPHSPLDFAEPLRIRRAGMEGGAVIDEVPGPLSADVLRAYRCILAWCRGESGETVAIRRTAAAEWLRALRTSGYARDASDPLRFIAGELARLHPRAPGLARVCNRLSAWALRTRAERTALLFAEAAALVEPADARAAWRTGRMLRDFGHPFEAEAWLRRAIRIATWQHDVATQDLALNSLGNLFCQQGCYDDAALYLRRALRLAATLDRPRRGAVTHDLMLVCIAQGKYPQAEELAAKALRLYGPNHPNLPRLGHDLVLLWMHQGKFSLSLPILRALLPRVRTLDERLRVLASLGRSAGALSDPSTFDFACDAAAELITVRPAQIRPVLPEALLDLATGAAGVKQWTRAADFFRQALKSGEAANRRDVVARAETGLELASRDERIDIQLRPASRAVSQLAQAVVRALESASDRPGVLTSRGEST